MVRYDAAQAGVLVGLEIHQQLNTGKLFCRCQGTRPPGDVEKFVRRLRPVKSELGGYDPAALFERTKNQTILYHADAANSCLVERDEEPPHDMDSDALKTVLVISAALKSRIFDEIYTMRKTVIDGSNTGGFQRTMLVSVGGELSAANRTIHVQSICLEEDSARVISEHDNIKEYGLDRLGIPLVEIALAPVSGTPREMRIIAQSLGHLLRSTGMVARGIGTIRQDVNVSVRDGGGIVEIKGLQQLEQLERIIEYEGMRQAGMVKISERLNTLGALSISEDDKFDVTRTMSACNSEIIQKALDAGHIIHAIALRHMRGTLGYEPYPGVRLGMELGQLVKFYGIGGIFHSDELPRYGILAKDLHNLTDVMKLEPDDAFVMVAGPSDRLRYAIDSIVSRMKAAFVGVPSETRLATSNGKTVFLRPRPGAARMYPETDILPTIISDDDIKQAAADVPEPWEKTVKDMAAGYGLAVHLSEQVLDSEYRDIFVDITSKYSVPPAFVASSLCSTITQLSREGLEKSNLHDHMIREIFGMLAGGDISKEAVEIIFRDIMSGSAKTVSDVVQRLDSADDDEISDILDDIISANRAMIVKLQKRAMGPLMGMAMKRLRGRASGQEINRMLASKISHMPQEGL